ncbi:hypothetical protein [Polyangium aurulentum]|uniref:hypothetical protein n=1 Tax=Polyangium aurulentum TaxID=2567896 RepID=UPI0010AE11FA|nr:hypothetical protein [Polyangium aurulentum]UQA62193.1 hypothetical protein E8A73_017685 [Polyangium aurulentum]
MAGRQRLLGAALGLGLCGLFSASGCELVAGLDGDYKLDTTPAAPVCDSARPPGPPTTQGAGGDVSFTVAIREVDLGETDKTPRFGFDLDEACSCTIDDHSCARPSWVDKTKQVCDDPRGIDNGMSIALNLANVIAGGALSSAIISDGALKGSWTLLLRVKGWSGMPDDDQVEVDIYQTPGFAAGTVPVWDGTDAWPVDDQSVNAMDVESPVLVDTAAYVRGGELVARLSSLRLPFRGEMMQLPVTVTSVVLSAKIDTLADGGYALHEGTLGAIWRLPDVFVALADLRYNVSDKLCRDDFAYSPVKHIFCDSTDIHSGGPPADGAEMPQCDAVSFGMRFETEPAQLGALVPHVDGPADACAAGQSPKDDHCK